MCAKDRSGEAGGEHRTDTVDRAQQEDEYIEHHRVGVDGRQLQVEIDQAEQYRHRQVDGHPGGRAADGLPGLPGPLGPGRILLPGVTGDGIEATAEGTAVEAAEIE